MVWVGLTLFDPTNGPQVDLCLGPKMETTDRSALAFRTFPNAISSLGFHLRTEINGIPTDGYCYFNTEADPTMPRGVSQRSAFILTVSGMQVFLYSQICRSLAEIHNRTRASMLLHQVYSLLESIHNECLPCMPTMKYLTVSRTDTYNSDSCPSLIEPEGPKKTCSFTNVSPMLDIPQPKTQSQRESDVVSIGRADSGESILSCTSRSMSIGSSVKESPQDVIPAIKETVKLQNRQGSIQLQYQVIHNPSFDSVVATTPFTNNNVRNTPPVPSLHIDRLLNPNPSQNEAIILNQIPMVDPKLASRFYAQKMFLHVKANNFSDHAEILRQSNYLLYMTDLESSAMENKVSKIVGPRFTYEIESLDIGDYSEPWEEAISSINDLLPFLFEALLMHHKIVIFGGNQTQVSQTVYGLRNLLQPVEYCGVFDTLAEWPSLCHGETVNSLLYADGCLVGTTNLQVLKIIDAGVVLFLSTPPTALPSTHRSSIIKVHLPCSHRPLSSWIGSKNPHLFISGGNALWLKKIGSIGGLAASEIVSKFRPANIISMLVAELLDIVLCSFLSISDPLNVHALFKHVHETLACHKSTCYVKRYFTGPSRFSQQSQRSGGYLSKLVHSTIKQMANNLRPNHQPIKLTTGENPNKLVNHSSASDPLSNTITESHIPQPIGPVNISMTPRAYADIRCRSVDKCPSSQPQMRRKSCSCGLLTLGTSRPVDLNTLYSLRYERIRSASLGDGAKHTAIQNISPAHADPSAFSLGVFAKALNSFLCSESCQRLAGSFLKLRLMRNPQNI